MQRVGKEKSCQTLENSDRALHREPARVGKLNAGEKCFADLEI